MDTAEPAEQQPDAGNGADGEKMDTQPIVEHPPEKKEKKPKKLVFELPIVKLAGYNIPLDALIAFEVWNFTIEERSLIYAKF